MNLSEKIELIILEQEVKPSDFMSITKISKTAYYSIKNGKTKKLSDESAKSIIANFPMYSYKWLMSNDNYENDSNTRTNNFEKTNFYNKDGSEVTFSELCSFVGRNFEEIINTPELKKPIDYFKLQVVNNELKDILKKSKD